MRSDTPTALDLRPSTATSATVPTLCLLSVTGAARDEARAWSLERVSVSLEDLFRLFSDALVLSSCLNRPALLLELAFSPGALETSDGVDSCFNADPVNRDFCGLRFGK